MEQAIVEQKMAVIRGYLLENIFQCMIQDGPTTDTGRTLLVTFGGTGKCELHLSSAVLSNENQTTLELGWGLKDNNIAAKVLNGSEFALTPDRVVPKD